MMLFRIALLSLWQARTRTGVLGGAIGFVSALLVLMLGVAEGMNRSLIEASTTLMSGHLNVAGFFKVTAGQAAPVVTKANALRAVVAKAVPEAKYVVSRGRGYAKVVSDQGSTFIGLAGVSVEDERGLASVLKLKEGSLADLSKPNSVVLFEEQASRLEVRVGDAVTVSAPTTRGVNNTVDLTVVGVAKNLGMMSQFSCFMNAKALQKLYQLNDDTTGALQIYLPTADLDEVKRLQGRLRESLTAAGYQVLPEDPRAFFFKFENVSREGWTGQRLDLTTWHDEVNFIAWTVDLMSALSFILAVVLLAIIGVGIMIVMWISVRGRTREIGALRAIGMQRTSVLAMFLAEGFLLGLLATLAGSLVGLLLSVLLTRAGVTLPQSVQFVLLSETLVVVPTARWTAIAVTFITAVVTGISLVPAMMAARLKPVTALGHVG
ncbi:MAG: FtsX-like permease family protein [Myxococcaceae bacterium]|jgi:ABC-type lipoprotein release transport system permease subunit|nr:FtsX-like permease family protein [Myxococcaceae bacterium]